MECNSFGEASTIALLVWLSPLLLLLQLKVLKSRHSPQFLGIFFSALSVDWTIEAWLRRRLCLILMSLNSISIGNLADPNTRKYHLPFAPTFLADPSTLLNFSNGRFLESVTSRGFDRFFLSDLNLRYEYDVLDFLNRRSFQRKNHLFFDFAGRFLTRSSAFFAAGGGSPYGMSLPQKIMCPEWCTEEMLKSSLEENSNKSS